MSTKTKEKAFSNISAKSFITVVAVLVVLLVFCGALSYFIPQGEFQRDEANNIIKDTYVQGDIKGIEIWRVVTAPFRVFAGADSITIIMISVFLLIMSGVFNLLEKTGGIKIFIVRIMNKLSGKIGWIIGALSLVFMFFGSMFGMFEELVTLLPIVIVFMLSLNQDTMMGLGCCLLSACFGFSAAITNPFSVGLASKYAGVSPASGTWLRVIFFIIVYAMVFGFLYLYMKKIKKSPEASPTYEIDKEKKAKLENTPTIYGSHAQRIFKTYSVFFAVQVVVLVLIASIRAISGLAIPILAASFLITGIICGVIAGNNFRAVVKYIIQGAVAMLPAVIMIALASSVTLVMNESGIMDTIMNFAITLLVGKSRFIAVLLIYVLILFLQIFIGSASAKIFLIMPIIVPIASALGISPSLVILTYCMADGFTDIIMPTNPVLLIGLSMADVSYFKWVKWTWKLQIFVFLVSILVLLFGVYIGY